MIFSLYVFQGKDEIQGIGLELQQQFNANWHPHCFSNLPNLKLLYLRDVSLSNSLSSLPIALKVLIWKSYPLESLPQNLDQLYELVDLELRYSKITHLWSGKPVKISCTLLYTLFHFWSILTNSI